MGGQSFGTANATGRLAGRPHDQSAQRVGDRYVVRLPGAGAAMLIAR